MEKLIRICWKDLNGKLGEKVGYFVRSSDRTPILVEPVGSPNIINLNFDKHLNISRSAEENRIKGANAYCVTGNLVKALERISLDFSQGLIAIQYYQIH